MNNFNNLPDSNIETEDYEDKQLTADQINKLLEEAEKEGNEMNEESLLNCLSTLKHLTKLNKTQRIKYQEQPSKYIDSETDLHEEIKVLQRMAAYPHLIDILIRNEGIDLLTSLLSHENIDIVDDVVVVFEEITDADCLQELENPKQFLEILIGSNIFELLVNNLFRLENESSNADDKQIVGDILSVLENFLDVYSYSSKLLGEKTKLFDWLIKRIRIGGMDTNKLFASELLNTLAVDANNQLILAKRQVLPHFLKILLEFQHKRISDSEEEEFIHNIVNTICSLLLKKENQLIFRNSDGIGIMLTFLKENNIYRHFGIKILDFATQNNSNNCKDLIELKGLSLIFSYFMGKGIKKKKKGKLDSLIEACEEHCISILVSLAKYLKGVQLDRFIHKFKENSQEKCERLFEFLNYYKKKFEKNYKNKSIEEDEEQDEDSIYIDKINSGLFNIQNISLIVCFLLSAKDEELIEKIRKLGVINNTNLDEFKDLLKDMYSHIGDDTEQYDYPSTKILIENLIKGL